MSTASPSLHGKPVRTQTLRLSVQTMMPLLLSGLLAGCAAGPDFKRPAPPNATSYTATPMPAQTASAAAALGNAQTFQMHAMVDAAWWRSLGSSRLDALIEQALQSSPTLAAAKASLRQAQELHSAQAGSTLYPQIDAGIGAQRQRTSPTA